jgi:hypothetical protein
MSKTVYGWHFLYEGHKLRTGEVAPADGKWLKVPGNPILCERGLHGSIQPFDALSHAPGPILTLCEFSGEIAHDADKLVAQRRKIIARMDAIEMLRWFSRTQAMSVAHLWEPPEIVAEFLMTGDESIRDAARDAAWAAARDAAWAAAWAAARDAARDAAWDAARAAAWAAARDAAWDAARFDFNALVCECFEGPLADIGWDGTTGEQP